MSATTAPLPAASHAIAVQAVGRPGDAAALTRALGGAYQIVRPLGAGGMGTVYLAEHTHLGRAVALKVLCPPVCFRDPVVERRFRREARLAARVNHPNVAQIYDLIVLQDERLVLVMEYVPGETLAARLRREGPLHPGEAVRVSGAVADGLDHAHALGIVHGDVKPANVILSEGGGAKLVDFGIAHDLFANPTVGELPAGTPQYMSPEQIAGESPGVASDVYGLGAVLYEALAGRPARLHPFGVTALDQRLTSPGGSAAELRERCPGLAEAVLRALDPLPSARWPSAGALAQAALSALEPPATLGRRLLSRRAVSGILDRVWPRRSRPV